MPWKLEAIAGLTGQKAETKIYLNEEGAVQELTTWTNQSGYEPVNLENESSVNSQW